MKPQYVCTHMSPAMHAMDPFYEDHHIERLGFYGTFTVKADAATPAGSDQSDNPYWAVYLEKIMPANEEDKVHPFSVVVCLMGNSSTSKWVAGVVMEFRARGAETEWGFDYAWEQVSEIARRLDNAVMTYTEYQLFAASAVGSSHNMFFRGTDEEYGDLTDAAAAVVQALYYPPEGHGRPGDVTLQ